MRINLPLGLALASCTANSMYVGNPFQLKLHTLLHNSLATHVPLTTEEFDEASSVAEVSISDHCALGLVQIRAIVEQHRLHPQITKSVAKNFCGHILGHVPHPEFSFELPSNSTIHDVNTSEDVQHTSVDSSFNVACATFVPRVPKSAYYTKKMRYVHDILQFRRAR